MSFAAPHNWVHQRDVAKHYGIASQTIAEWATLGCPHYQITPGGRRYYVIAEVEAWLTSRQQGDRSIAS